MTDRRVMKEVTLFGRDSMTGLNVYLFRYAWDTDQEAMRIGPMADEVAQAFPNSVYVDDNGFLRIKPDFGAGHS